MNYIEKLRYKKHLREIEEYFNKLEEIAVCDEYLCLIMKKTNEHIFAFKLHNLKEWEEYINSLDYMCLSDLFNNLKDQEPNGFNTPAIFSLIKRQLIKFNREIKIKDILSIR